MLKRLVGPLVERIGRIVDGALAFRSGVQPAHLMERATRAAERGDRASAAAMLEQLVARFPSHAAGQRLLGEILTQNGEYTRALYHIEAAAALSPRWPDAHLARGNALRLLGDARGAEESYRSAIALDPDAAGPHYSLARLLKAAGRRPESLEHVRRAHELAPGYAEATWELVRELLDSGEPAAARAAAERTLAAGAASPLAHKSLGLVQLWQHEPQAARERFLHAVELAPDDVEAWLHAGIAAQELARLDEAQAAYEKALELKPGHAPALWRRALVRLLKGDLEAGWRDYEARHASIATAPRRFPQPGWQGEPLEGRTLLVYAEQGLGDEIMFASCFPQVIARAAHCIIECHPKLERLFRRSFPAASVHGGSQADDPAWLAQYPAPDFGIAAGSLPRMLRSKLDDFPRHAGYLTADPARVAAWRERLAALGPGLKVGLSWQGGTRLSRSGLRSLTLDALLPVLGVPGVRFIDLQYSETAAERARLQSERGIGIVHWQDALDDYDETAALTAAVDLTLTVCTALVHLAGALGRPAWVMTPFSPEWRYGHAGNSMPWYPSVRLVRQPRFGEWEPVVTEVARDLESRARARSRP